MPSILRYNGDMALLKRVSNSNQVGFWCPGCQEMHFINTTWQITGTDDCPTFSPSVLVTSGHYVSSHKPGSPCWCTYNAENPDRPGPKCSRCHSFVKSGKIEFLKDCTHGLAGKTVPMEQIRQEGN